MNRRTPQVGLTFNEKTHVYRLDGQHVPGVTTILKVLDRPGLRDWAARSVAEYVADHPAMIEGLYESGRGPMVAMLKQTPWQKRDDAAERGTEYHEHIAAILRGEEPMVPESQEGLVQNGLAFLEDYDVQPLLIEAAVGSRKHRYGGTLDLIADTRIGRIALDWKSGKRIYPSTALQVAAYAFAEFEGLGGDEKPIPEVEAAYGLQVADDSYTLIPLKFGPDVFDEFVKVREVYDINKRVEGDWKQPGSGYAGLPVTPFWETL